MRFFKLRLHILLLTLIFFVALGLRFYELSQNPPGLDWDEANSIYNGYSLVQTGKDEYRQSYPILFRAFDAYVPPLLIYLDAFSSSVFGLNEFAARFPTAILGSLSIVGLYLLVSVVAGDKKFALLSALLLALSPWHITYSRVGTFASLPIIFILFGTFFFSKSLTKSIFLIIASLCFIAAVLSYYSAYVFVPLYVIALVVIYRKHVMITHAVFVLIVVTGAAVIMLMLPGGQTRLHGVFSFSDPDLIKKDAQYAAAEPGGKILHNRRLVYLQKILEGYFAPFQYSFLFSKADMVSRFVVPGTGFGLLYWWELPMLLAGIYQLLRSKTKGWQMICIWFLLAALPGAPTLLQPTSTRAIFLVPVLAMLVACGFLYITSNGFRLVRVVTILLFAVNVLLFMHQYFVHFPKEKSEEWFAAYKPLFTYLNHIENREKNIIFFTSPPDYLDQVHIFTAFYNRIDPVMYQAYGGTRLGRYGTTGEFKIGRFIFISPDCIRCKNELTQKIDDLLVTARALPFQPVITFPQGDRPTLFIYQAIDVSLEDIIKFKAQ